MLKEKNGQRLEGLLRIWGEDGEGCKEFSLSFVVYLFVVLFLRVLWVHWFFHLVAVGPFLL